MDDFERAVGVWRGAGRVVALTGAGVSVASGIPDFRSPGGLWSRFDPDEVASAWALRNNPRGVWEFLLEAMGVFERARPNGAHHSLARLEGAGRLEAIVTQNIDGLHQAAGSREVVEFHGGLGRWRCNVCGFEAAPGAERGVGPEDIPWLCPACGGVMRPDVVFFGEDIPRGALNRTRELSVQADLVVVVGTSGEVAPANLLPYDIKRRGGRVIEINLGPSAFGDLADVRLDGRAEVVLPELAGRLA